MILKLIDLLDEGYFEDAQVSHNQDRIHQLQQSVAHEREKLQNARKVQQRKRELEKIRTQHEKEHDQGKRQTTEASKKVSGIEAMTDQRGRVIGYRQERGNRTTFLNAKGQVVAREIGNRTLDGKNKFIGFGKQGLRMLGT